MVGVMAGEEVEFLSDARGEGTAEGLVAIDERGQQALAGQGVVGRGAAVGL